MRALLVVLVVTLFALMCPPLPAALVTASGLGGAVTIAGVVPVAVREGLAMRDMMLPANTDLHFVLGLSSRNPAGFDAALRAVYDPHNPMYRHFLAAETITTRFGPDPAQVQALKQWLVSQGLHPQPWAGSMLLDVRGTAARVSTAFGIGMWHYRPAAQLALKSAVSVDAANRIVPSFAPDRDPRVPSQFSGLITSIVGLQGTIQPVAQAVAHAAPAARPRRGPAGGYDPAQIAGAYDFKPLYAAGYHAANTRVAIVEFAPYDPADIRAYDTWAGVNSTIHNIAVGDSTGSHTGSIEATLDIELLSSTAPGATIDVYNAPNDATGVGLLDAYSAVVSAGNAQVLGLTWVTCEAAALQIKGLVPDEHALFKQLALLGTTIVSATGDAGAYACSDSRGASTSLASQPTVNLPASDPYSLAVAATDLTVRTTSGVSAIGYETAWSCNATHSPACAHTGFKGLGSGGGVSTVFQTGDTYGDDMSWQIGPGVGNKFSGGARQVPDVAISGSSGISIEHEYSIYWQHSWKVGGGTSASAILWAALVLLTDQYLAAHNKPDAGWINPLVYKLGATLQPYPPYHDIVVGDNLLFNATAGWDHASGWGSPDAWNFVLDIAAATGSNSGATPTTTSPGPDATATKAPKPDPTATPSATRTALPTSTAKPTPTGTQLPAISCPAVGLGNGAFMRGTLVCWTSNGRPAPRVVAAPGPGRRFAVQIGGARGQRSASSLSQSILPPGTAHATLHVEYWVASSNSGCSFYCPRKSVPAKPLLTLVTSSNAKTARHFSLTPRREATWTTFTTALAPCPVHGHCRPNRLTITVTVPPQPSGIREVLYVRAVYLTS